MFEMELFYIALGLSFPIFYVWGAISAFQRFFGNKKQDKTDESAKKMLEYLFQRVEENPELSLQDFLSEVRGDVQDVSILNQDSITPDTMSTENEQAKEAVEDPESEWAKEKIASINEQQDEAPRRLGDLVTAPTNYTNESVAPSFSWREWYADHSIDFILYLGAFMIVAAVTLFVGFQWENFGGVTRFAIVVAFTAGWYVAGIAVQRLLSLDGVGIAFITIGAILTPFCGIAWQEFVIGSLDNVGVTWLITSLVGTLIYLALSLMYQRRHFTYFGNLSILATMLSFVELNNAPDEYFILASNLTGLLLLAGRIAVKQLAPRLDAYLGEDFERSSLAILVFSLIAGIFLLPVSNIPIASIQVLAVMASTLTYFCLFTWLKTNRYTVVFTQVFAIATFANALITFNIDAQLALMIVFVVHLGLQFTINNWLDGDRKEIFSTSNTVSLILSGILYLTAFALSYGGFLAIPAAIALIAHSAFFANRLEKPFIWYLTAILFYLLLAHILSWLNIPEEMLASAFIVLAATQLLTMRSNLDTNVTKALSYTSLLILGLIGFISLGLLLENARYSPLELTLYRLNPFASLGLFSFAMLLDKSREEKILKSYISVVLASVSILYYLAGVQLEIPLMSISFALAISAMFWLAIDLTKFDILYFVVFAASYFALFHILEMFGLSQQAYLVSGFTILAAIQLHTMKSNSDAGIAIASTYTSLLVLAGCGFVSLVLLQDNSNLDMFESILLSVSPFASLALLSIAMLLDKPREEKILKSYVPVVLASISIIYYIASLQFDNSLMSIGLALAISCMFWLAIDLTKFDILYFVVFGAPYFALFHVLKMVDLPLEIYPIAFSVLSVWAFVTKLLPNDTEVSRKLIALIALIGVSIWMFILGIEAEISLHFSGWVSSYTFLALLWMCEDVLGKSLRNGVFSVAVMLQYVWHVIFLEYYVDAVIFGDVQWYSAAIGTFLFGASIRYSQQEDVDSDNNVFVLQFVASVILMLPTLGQIIFESTLLYFGLGVLYSLLIGAIAITFKQTRIRTISAISLVLVVLFQSREFLINLPRWIIIGGIGFGLIGAGLYLYIRRRNVKKEIERTG